MDTNTSSAVDLCKRYLRETLCLADLVMRPSRSAQAFRRFYTETRMERGGLFAAMARDAGQAAADDRSRLVAAIGEKKGRVRGARDTSFVIRPEVAPGRRYVRASTPSRAYTRDAGCDVLQKLR
jgi:hypothetical protein